MAKVLGLPLVLPADELRGIAPPAFERAAHRAKPGDDTHRGLIHVCACVAWDAVRACAPPSARAPVRTALDAADEWTRGKLDVRAIQRARSELFTALLVVESKTVEAVRASLVLSDARADSSPIDDHADAVVCRYAGLGAHYAASAAVLTLDAIVDPREAPRVPSQAAGGMAYRQVGLGVARSAELRNKACAHAEWEHGRPGAPPAHGVGALSVQLFHEYLGASFKDVSDAQRVYYFELVEWALPPALRAS